MKKKLIYPLLIIITILLLVSANDTNIVFKKTEPRTYIHFCFDTICQITIYSSQDKDEQTIVNECFDICDKYDQTFNKYRNDSDIFKINSSENKYADVSDETLKIVEDSIYYSTLSHGAFDITISPITDLWDINNNPHIPQRKKINKALKTVNYKDILIKNKKIKLSKKNQSIDLGGIAKGYVADKIKEYLINNNVSSAIINLGGNILTIGNNNNQDFKIGIKKPFGKNDSDYSATILLSDKSVVTSGIYERYFKKNDKIYHHILDPQKGYPCDNNLYSVTIISDKSEDGDALSTACFVLGLDKGRNLINSLNDVYAVFITKDYKIHLSEGLNINDKKIITIVK